MLVANAQTEQMLASLGAKLYELGFHRSERLIPPSYPIVMGQPVVRYRSDDGAKSSVLYQAGADVFSVHGIPPYSSWEHFVPSVQLGVEAIVQARGENQTPFSQVSLRYLDFFGDGLVAGRSISAFVSEVLGFRVELPTPVVEVASSKELQSLLLRFVLPVEGGVLNLVVGDGRMNNQTGVIMDVTVTSATQIAGNYESVIKIFNSAHDTISKIFLGVTKPIEDLMQPRIEGGR
jgi:uncharacterized protein (TIGR04255 family)